MKHFLIKLIFVEIFRGYILEHPVYIILVLSYGSLNPQAIAKERHWWANVHEREKEAGTAKKVERLACSRRHVLKFQADLEWKERGSNERRAFCRGHTESKRWMFSGLALNDSR